MSQLLVFGLLHVCILYSIYSQVRKVEGSSSSKPSNTIEEKHGGAIEVKLPHPDRKQFYFSKTKETWEKAKIECEKKEYHIATITNKKQHALMTKAKEKIVPKGDDEMFWLGARDPEHDCTFRWDGSPDEPIKFKNWTIFEGTACTLSYLKDPHREFCLTQAVLWNLRPCDYMFRYICEYF